MPRGGVPAVDEQTDTLQQKEHSMKTHPCPHCGRSMRLELNRTLVQHPTRTDCIIGGRTFRVARKPSDRRPTWDEYVAKHTRSAPETPADPPKSPGLPLTPPPPKPELPGQE